MNFFAVFLRGVNVGGVKVLMKDLTTLLQDAGFESIRTFLASGNVVLAAEEADPLVIKNRIEAALLEHYGREIPVIVQDATQLDHFVQNYPFVPPEDGIARHRYLVLTSTTEDAAGILQSAPDPTATERLASLGHGICWEVERGDSLGTPLAKHFTKVASKFLVTTRNMNTIEKIDAALRAASA
ncbi:DUF1697 domain-containing protein [Paeniglutamicibacter sp. Y32M11]|uniref:DUF1697 domain-containing protein n=1 Tax=Paeniglutamicibacter sp. Y32M11 TaxID=2853258 RepID=UPI001C52E9FC|nr:DUF1697 domain-containing protein [Paeniglutamicibacter sp. Y32M11]QXQ09660.1 DUF1697 domain-containing protein [Paeniglutamicibacter sp. Y32M11]